MDVQRICLVRVTTDDSTYRLWAVATSRRHAVSRVLNAIPEGWCARLLNEPTKPWMRASMANMVSGDVHELTLH